MRFLLSLLRDYFLFRGDADAVRRIAYEFCEDSSKNNIIYSEVRFCPHLFSNTVPDNLYKSPVPQKEELTPHRVTELVLEGLKEGQEKFGVKVGLVLACLRPAPGETPLPFTFLFVHLNLLRYSS